MFLELIAIGAFVGFAMYVFQYISQEVAEGRRVYADYIFNGIFALVFAIWGFILMADDIPGKIAGACLFCAIGWFGSFVFSGLSRLIPKKQITVAVQVICVVALVIVVFSSQYKTEPIERSSYSYSETTHKCCICGKAGTKYYGKDYWCADHYYKAKAMDGNLDP